MAAQLLEVIHGVTRAYTFTVRYRNHELVIFGSIAKSYVEAVAEIRSRLSYLTSEDLTIFNTGVTVLQPAMITRWDRNKTVEEKGYYAFLEGLFFARYGDFQVIDGCRKEKTSTGWYATIYGRSHSVKPLK